MAEYIALVRPTDIEGQVELVVYKDTTVIHLEDGDEFVTIQTKVDLFDG